MLPQFLHHLSINIGQGRLELQIILKLASISSLDQVSDTGEETVQSRRRHFWWRYGGMKALEGCPSRIAGSRAEAVNDWRTWWDAERRTESLQNNRADVWRVERERRGDSN